MAFHATGTPVDDFAALLSDASVFQFLARPKRDLEGMTLLGTALLLNGISMSICGSSRPASGSEHLISHALDSVSKRPRLHGLQVGVATYLMSLLSEQVRTPDASRPSSTLPDSGAPSPAIHLIVPNGLKRPHRAVDQIGLLHGLILPRLPIGESRARASIPRFAVSLRYSGSSSS